MEDNKVISSKITRDYKPLKNNLYELFNIQPATPTFPRDDKKYSFNFTPVIGKIYVPKKRHRFMRVKTVRDIRNEFESDISTELSKDLEKQQNLLLKKITCGSSREENTKTIARNMLKYDKPISRCSWQMLMNVNSESHPHTIQYVLWNGKRIRVNGSRGGKNKFLYNYDVANIKKPLKKETKQKAFNSKKGLLHNSLKVKFKPGPLTRKKSLDESFQKYNVGKTEVVNLPKLGLNIQPSYGICLEPIIADFIQGLRDSDGTISESWAEFAVSVLGTDTQEEPVQNKEKSGVTFDLNYKCNQQRILMRRNINNTNVEMEKSNSTEMLSKVIDKINIASDVENILKEMIHAVEISLQQDSFFANEVRNIETESSFKETAIVSSTIKDKGNKRRFCELDRLDVTVIRLPHITEDDFSKTCNNAYCALGCVCQSLQRSYNLRQHCGRLDCMFECKCDFAKYKGTDTFHSDCSELLPGLINLDNKLNLKLAKEEQKFHQTVVMTGEKSILLKTEKRNWKASKRYGDFYESMCLKNDIKGPRMLSVVDVKLNCANIEPWCMVHNLYKCFCKGKFIQNSTIKVDDIDTNETICHEDKSISKNLTDVKDKKRNHERNTANNNVQTHNITECSEVIELDSDNATCARSRSYKGRKFCDSYYLNMNKKIKEMEENDDNLRKRMLTILNKPEDSDDSNQSKKTAATEISLDKMMKTRYQSRKKAATEISKVKAMESSEENHLFDITTDKNRSLSPTETVGNGSLALKSLSKDNFTPGPPSSEGNLNPGRTILSSTTNRPKLISWLESSYKQYKQRIEQGIIKNSLDPPKNGKVALYPWEFILNRYRERKNLFLISKQQPIRIFMAVDSTNPFFENCLNIDDIRFADLHKYPLTIKNLLTNATDLKHNFCILCGLAFCWELIGSVAKLDGTTKGTDVLQSVSDDRKVSFVSQETDSEFETSKKSDIIASDCMTGAENPQSTALLSEMMKTTIPKRQGNIEKLSNRGDKKVKTVTNYENTTPKDLKELTVNKVDDKYSTSFDALESSALNKDIQVDDPAESKSQDESSLSKWFLMTVENDFSEIQFYNRGFFVKYESIIKAIQVARISGKTVRLSAQKSADQSNNNPQFGIYAIPNLSNYYVFIGPYDKVEFLGIETVKSLANIGQTKKTRGVWITTKKVDNAKVIDNPLSFMPHGNLHRKETVCLENVAFSNGLVEDEEDTSNHSSNDSEGSTPISKDSPSKNNSKILKPIKIRKTDSLYQLAPPGILTQVLPKSVEGTPNSLMYNASNNLLQPVKLLRQLQSERRPVNVPLLKLPIPRLPLYHHADQPPQSLLKKLVLDDRSQNTKPVAEIAPQIKIVDVYSESTSQGGSKRPEGSMFILKPEEINKRLIESTISSSAVRPSNTHNNLNTAIESNLDDDIENFLATSTAYVPPNADIFEISDEEDDSMALANCWKNVWIECESAQLGFIKGRRDVNNMLSFEFPGFKFTDFYPEEEAFCKINQVLSRKVYVPKSINLTWHVVEKADDLIRKFELKADVLGTDFVLTRRGIRHKKMMVANKTLYKTSTDTSAGAASVTVSKLETAVENTMDFSELEEQSKILEEEGQKLMNEMAKITTITSLAPTQARESSPEELD